MKLHKLMKEITIDLFISIRIFIEDHLRYVPSILNITYPYLIYYIGYTKGFIPIILSIPIAINLMIYYLNSFANKIGKGSDVPIPTKRFTQEDDSGEVTIETNRVQELILYMNDLENWLNRKGYL